MRKHRDIVFRSYMSYSRGMDASYPAFARVWDFVGKVNLLSSSQMSEEMLALGRRKNP